RCSFLMWIAKEWRQQQPCPPGSTKTAACAGPLVNEAIRFFIGWGASTATSRGNLFLFFNVSAPGAIRTSSFKFSPTMPGTATGAMSWIHCAVHVWNTSRCSFDGSPGVGRPRYENATVFYCRCQPCQCCQLVGILCDRVGT